MFKRFRKKLLMSLMKTKFFYWFLMRFLPYIRFTTYYTSFRGWRYKRGYQILKSGDIILATDDKKLTSLLVPGDWSHAALCIEKSEESEWEISEMTHEDYTQSTFFDICKESTRVSIWRCSDWDEEYVRDQVVPSCKSLLGTVYDTLFVLGIKALYCSELVYMSDPEKRLDVNLADEECLGQEYISPTGLSRAKNVYCVWDSEKEIHSLEMNLVETA